MTMRKMPEESMQSVTGMARWLLQVIARKRKEEGDEGNITGTTEVQPRPVTRRMVERVEREGNTKGIDGQQSLQVRTMEQCEGEGIRNMTESQHPKLMECCRMRRESTTQTSEDGDGH